MKHDNPLIAILGITFAVIAIYSNPASAECYGVSPRCPQSYSDMMDYGNEPNMNTDNPYQINDYSQDYSDPNEGYSFGGNSQSGSPLYDYIDSINQR